MGRRHPEVGRSLRWSSKIIASRPPVTRSVAIATAVKANQTVDGGFGCNISLNPLGINEINSFS